MYGDWLRERMAERGVSQRQLGARLSPGNPEVGRRTVRRYLNGTTPGPRNREAIAAALGLNETGPEDEEDDLVAALMAGIQELTALAERVRQHTRKVA